MSYEVVMFVFVLGVLIVWGVGMYKTRGTLKEKIIWTIFFLFIFSGTVWYASENKKEKRKLKVLETQQIEATGFDLSNAIWNYPNWEDRNGGAYLVDPDNRCLMKKFHRSPPRFVADRDGNRFCLPEEQ